MMLYVIIFLTFVVGMYSETVSTCPGKWIETDYPTPIYGLQKSFKEYASKEEIMKQICPAETFYYNCVYNGIADRSNILQHRKFQYDDRTEQPCHDFHPKRFLETVRNRNVFFSGDSIMHQMWQAIACRIMSVIYIPPEDIHIQFGYSQEPHFYENNTCPFGADHCRLLMWNSFYVAEYNTSIMLRYEGMYDPGLLWKYWQDKKITANDIMIYNFGVHYHSEAMMKNDMHQFASDFVSIREGSRGEGPAQLLKNNFFFMEAAPQHFPRVDVPNGYYTKLYAAEWCEPQNNNMSITKAMDWRNRLPEQILTPLGIPIIPIVEPLYSQFDTHIASDSKMTKFSIADCTHFCANGPVLPYILSQIQNYLQQNSYKWTKIN